MSKQRSPGIITLLTDFGLKDPFVGVMKGVILRRFPEASIVDLAHGIEAQNIVEGSFWLERSFRWFPVGTVHVAVVDPGVGGPRGRIAVCADEHFFIAPDNGLLADVIRSAADVEVRDIDLEVIGAHVPSRTFHGRDIFAPAAAELASGRLAFSSLGHRKSPLLAAHAPSARRTDSGVEGQVVSVDRFGNLITNISAELMQNIESPMVCVAEVEQPLKGAYVEVAEGELIGLINSFDTLELAVRDGSAASALGFGVGALVRVKSAEK